MAINSHKTDFCSLQIFGNTLDKNAKGIELHPQKRFSNRSLQVSKRTKPIDSVLYCELQIGFGPIVLNLRRGQRPTICCLGC